MILSASSAGAELTVCGRPLHEQPGLGACTVMWNRAYRLVAAAFAGQQGCASCHAIRCSYTAGVGNGGGGDNAGVVSRGQTGSAGVGGGEDKAHSRGTKGQGVPTGPNHASGAVISDASMHVQSLQYVAVSAAKWAFRCNAKDSAAHIVSQSAKAQTNLLRDRKAMLTSTQKHAEPL